GADGVALPAGQGDAVGLGVRAAGGRGRGQGQRAVAARGAAAGLKGRGTAAGEIPNPKSQIPNKTESEVGAGARIVSGSGALVGLVLAPAGRQNVARGESPWTSGPHPPVFSPGGA